MNKVYAQPVTVNQPSGFMVTDIGTIVSGAISLAFFAAGVIIFVFLVFGGILMITAGGDKTQTEHGSGAVGGAMVGFAVIAAAWAIMQLLQYLFGVNFTGALPIPSFY